MTGLDNQAARRRQIAEALWRVTLRRGLEGASMRHLAVEAGVSVGMLQHYFRTKDDLLRFALDSMTEQVSRRIGERFATLPDPATPKQQVRAILIEMLPLDEERRIEAYVACAFLTRAAVDSRIADYLRDGHIQGHAHLTGQISQGLSDDPTRDATVLLALVNGLTSTVLAGQCPPEEAIVVLDAQLDRLFGQP